MPSSPYVVYSIFGSRYRIATNIWVLNIEISISSIDKRTLRVIPPKYQWRYKWPSISGATNCISISLLFALEVGERANPRGGFGMAGNRAEIPGDTILERLRVDVPRFASLERFSPEIPLDAILERFRELKIRDGEGGAEEIVAAYGVVLSELTFDSKPIIGNLTVIADEYKDFAEDIAVAICGRVRRVPVEHKLGLFYLIDSIITNIGGEYLGPFAVLLPEVFGEAYHQVTPEMQKAMMHLLRAWVCGFTPYGTLNRIFPVDVTFKIALGVAPNHPFLRNHRLFRELGQPPHHPI